ncbi:helix-turn-helix domain-containing protein [Vibrio campbellii]|uniref:helix-turn-helix domain-containing protein n=1 Tax=Vibrio campbellii TaxID=680 RepID=UPI000CD33C97|nr:helix-turn-helix transcriptional regulator [Vibrio campbellii]AUW05279.1 XRE family transcriptional regulator [Vibrio campbellii]
MFGDYLKQLRVQQGLTQRELATKLNLANPEFASVDSVTVSRWERNTTTPNTIKAIKVLRELTLDLKPFLLSIPSPEDETFLDDILYTRFRSQRALLMMSDYEELKPSEEIEITEETLFEDEVDAHLTRLKNFFLNADAHYPGMIDLDFLTMHEEKKLIAKVYKDSASQKVRGHSISFLFRVEDLDTCFSTPHQTLPFNLARAYSEARELALCCLSRYATSEQVFMILHPTLVDYIAQRSNITQLYYYAFDNQFTDYLVSLGAEKIAYDTPDKIGSVKIGKTAYRKCLLKVDTAVLLAQPSIISLLHQHQANIINS